ncbi:MAG: hypothetical protein IKF71_01500 [Bacilli bacterium]|nr:hypothetical protein [Bacilli bacterium]
MNNYNGPINNNGNMNNPNSFNMDYYKLKRKKNVALLCLAVFLLAIGYAFLQSLLRISGTTTVAGNTWSIYWENPVVSDGSVSGNQVDEEPTLTDDDTTVSFEVSLNKPGEFYEFTIDAVNAGSIDASIDSIEKTVDDSTTIPAYLSFVIEDSEGNELEEDHMLPAGTPQDPYTETYTIRVEYKKDINSSQLPTVDTSHVLVCEINYVQAISSPSPSPTSSGLSGGMVTNGYGYNINDYSINMNTSLPEGGYLYGSPAIAVQQAGVDSPIYFKYFVEDHVIKRIFLCSDDYGFCIEGAKNGKIQSEDITQAEFDEIQANYYHSVDELMSSSLAGSCTNLQDSVSCTGDMLTLTYSLDGTIDATFTGPDETVECKIEEHNGHYGAYCIY